MKCCLYLTIVWVGGWLTKTKLMLISTLTSSSSCNWSYSWASSCSWTWSWAWKELYYTFPDGQQTDGKWMRTDGQRTGGGQTADGQRMVGGQMADGRVEVIIMLSQLLDVAVVESGDELGNFGMIVNTAEVVMAQHGHYGQIVQKYWYECQHCSQGKSQGEGLLKSQ